MEEIRKDLGSIDKKNVTEIVFSSLESKEFITKFQTFLSGLEISTFMSLKSKTESVSRGRTFYIHNHKDVVDALKKDFKDILEHSPSAAYIEGLIMINAEMEGEYEEFGCQIKFIME